MQDPEQMIDRFSRRIYLKDRVGSAYIAPVRESNRILRSIMEYLVETSPNNSSEDWARSFLKSFLGAHKIYRLLVGSESYEFLINLYLVYLKICQELFFNYLQTVCWHAAIKTNQMFRSANNIDLHYSIEDCFTIACISIYQPTKLFKGFDFQERSSLEGYAFNTLKRVIKNQIAKELKSKSIKLSDNGLLRNLDKTELEKVLKANQYSRHEIELYSLVLQSFKELFEELYPATSSNGTRTKKPQTTPLDDRQLAQIAKRYNQQIKRLGIQSKLANAQDIKQMLAVCVQTVRNKTNPKSISMEEPGTGEIIDSTSNPLESAVKQESNNELMEVKKIILQELEALDNLAKQSLLLWLGLGINQEDFLGILNLSKQYQVARKFQGYQKIILKSLSQFTFKNYKQTNLSEKDINQIINNNLNNIKEYLRSYSRDFFEEILWEIITKEIDRQEKFILKHHFEEMKTMPKENLKNERSDNEEVKQKVKVRFVGKIEQKLQISLSIFQSANQSIENFIETCFQENTAILY
jgi:hypothetical protein